MTSDTLSRLYSFQIHTDLVSETQVTHDAILHNGKVNATSVRRVAQFRIPRHVPVIRAVCLGIMRRILMGPVKDAGGPPATAAISLN